MGVLSISGFVTRDPEGVCHMSCGELLNPKPKKPKSINPKT